jgi:hypothetical protein
MMVLKEDAAKITPPSHTPNATHNSYPSTINLMNCFQPFKLKPITADIRIYRVDKNGYLELKKVQGFSILQLL